jgi:hypothetical protein
MNGAPVYFRAALEEQGLYERFDKFLKQALVQGRHHRVSQTLCPFQVVFVFGPGYGYMNCTLRQQIFNFDCLSILDESYSFAVAGWLDSKNAAAFSPGVPPTYYDTARKRRRSRQYHIRNNAIVHNRLDQQTWVDECLE